MAAATEFTAVLRRYMAQALRSNSDLSRLTGISVRTIEKWTAGEVRRPRFGTDLLKVARALALTESDTSILLTSAGFPPLPVLAAQARQANDLPLLILLATWDITTPAGGNPLLTYTPQQGDLSDADDNRCIAQRATAIPALLGVSADATCIKGVPDMDAASTTDLALVVTQRLTMTYPVEQAAQAELTAWAAACEDQIRRGDLRHLMRVLDQPPPHGDALVLFYRGRLAVQQAEYMQAEQHFQAAAATARTGAQRELHDRSLLWIAYCHNLLGNYRLARTLAEQVTSAVPIDSPIAAEGCLVRGLIAADNRALPEAYELLEQARDLALLLPDRYLEARCCANLAPICINLGRLDRAGQLIQRAEQLSQEGAASPLQLLQVYNANVYRLRFMGDLDAALRVAPAVIEGTDDSSRHFRGWLAFSTAMAAIDADRFTLAEQAWQRACELLVGIDDNQLSRAELLWGRAWLSFRQDRLDEAHTESQAALRLIAAGMDTEYVHALAVAAIIDLARDDLALVSQRLREASDCFRMAQHQVGLASILLHIAAYHLRAQRATPARATLAEALTLLRRYRLYGAYHWVPTTMAALCAIAMAEDWGDDPQIFVGSPLTPMEDALHTDVYALENSPQELLGEFAAQLAARRLATNAWRTFAALLADHRPRVRRRAAQVLLASPDPAAQVHTSVLQTDPDPAIRDWFAQQRVAVWSGTTW